MGRWYGGAWWWASWGPDGPSTIAVSPSDGGVRGEAWGPAATDLLDRLPGLVGAGQPEAIRYPGSPADPYLKRSIGVRLAATGDLYEPLVRAVVGQVVTTTEAGRSLSALAARHGDRAPGPGPAQHALPPPPAVAALSYEELHELGIERRRAQILIEVARRWSRVEPMTQASVADAQRRLEAIRGIGPWSSAHAVGVAMGASDVIPVGDYHLPNQVAWALAGEDRGDDARMLELLEPYRGQRRRVLTAIVLAGVHAPRYGPRTATRRHL